MYIINLSNFKLKSLIDQKWSIKKMVDLSHKARIKSTIKLGLKIHKTRDVPNFETDQCGNGISVA